MTNSDMTIPEWCDKHRISRSMFYKLRNAGRGPRVNKIGRRTTISALADAEWSTRMEQISVEASAATDRVKVTA